MSNALKFLLSILILAITLILLVVNANENKLTNIFGENYVISFVFTALIPFFIIICAFSQVNRKFVEVLLKTKSHFLKNYYLTVTSLVPIVICASFYKVLEVNNFYEIYINLASLFTIISICYLYKQEYQNYRALFIPLISLILFIYLPIKIMISN